MDTMDRLSGIIIETLRELSDNRQPLTVDSMHKALSSRADLGQLMSRTVPGNGTKSDMANTAGELEEHRARAHALNEGARNQLREIEELRGQNANSQEFARRALLTFSTMLGSQENKAVRAALDEFKRKLKGEMVISSLEESLQKVRHLVMQEGLVADKPLEDKTRLWNKWFGRAASGGRVENSAVEQSKQIQELYTDILECLPLGGLEVFTERCSELKSQLTECHDLQQLVSLKGQVISFVQDFSSTIAEERSIVTSFIADIGTNLSQIEKHFAASFSLNSEEKKSSRKFNIMLDGQIKDLKKSAHISKTLVELQGFVNSRLTALREALDQRRSEEEQRWERARREKALLEKNLQNVRTEIEGVQAKTIALERETLLDPLTDIYNRRAYEQRLKQEMQRFKRYGQSFSLLLFDVDHFKNINDQYGHAAGDKCLKEMIQRFKPILRESDFLARYGGEEFIILLPGVDREGAYQAGEKLRRTLEHIRFRLRGKDIPLTISIGVSEVSDTDKDERSLFQRVDKAVYEAKRLGRNRTVAF